jgi:hypothetical protein
MPKKDETEFPLVGQSAIDLAELATQPFEAIITALEAKMGNDSTTLRRFHDGKMGLAWRLTVGQFHYTGQTISQAVSKAVANLLVEEQKS